MGLNTISWLNVVFNCFLFYIIDLGVIKDDFELLLIIATLILTCINIFLKIKKVNGHDNTQSPHR